MRLGSRGWRLAGAGRDVVALLEGRPGSFREVCTPSGASVAAELAPRVRIPVAALGGMKRRQFSQRESVSIGRRGRGTGPLCPGSPGSLLLADDASVLLFFVGCFLACLPLNSAATLAGCARKINPSAGTRLEG